MRATNLRRERREPEGMKFTMGVLCSRRHGQAPPRLRDGHPPPSRTRWRRLPEGGTAHVNPVAIERRSTIHKVEMHVGGRERTKQRHRNWSRRGPRNPSHGERLWVSARGGSGGGAARRRGTPWRTLVDTGYCWVGSPWRTLVRHGPGR